MPQTCDDPDHHLHKCFLHIAYLYVDLREAIRWENGPQIVCHWKWWLPRFLATGHTNYASETVHFIANLQLNFPMQTYCNPQPNCEHNQENLEEEKTVDQLVDL